MNDITQITLMNELKNILSLNNNINNKRVKIRKHFPLTLNNERLWEFDLSNNKLYIKTNTDTDDYIFDADKRFGNSYSLLVDDTPDVYQYVVDTTINEIDYFNKLHNSNNLLGFIYIKKINKNEFCNYEEYQNMSNIKEIYHFAFQRNQCNYISFVTNKNKINVSNCIVYAITHDNILNIFFSYDTELYIDDKLKYINEQIDKNNILKMIYSFGCLLGCNTCGESILSNLTESLVFEFTDGSGNKYTQTQIPENEKLKKAVLHINKNLFEIYFRIIKQKYNWFINDIILIKNNDLKIDINLSFDYSTHFKFILSEKIDLDKIIFSYTTIKLIKETDYIINIYMKNEDVKDLDNLLKFISNHIYSN